jgi:hypothetical protein
MFLLRYAKVGLIDQRSRLQSVIATFAPHIAGG